MKLPLSRQFGCYNTQQVSVHVAATVATFESSMSSSSHAVLKPSTAFKA
jgi:hypothetical protein